MKIIVGMTGGVDSAVAAYLLKKQGHQCIGVAIVTVDHQFIENKIDEMDNSETEKDKNKNFSLFMQEDRDHKAFLDNNCSVKNLEGIRSLCESLEMPFFAISGKDEFEATIFDPLVASKLSGEGFSTCFLCHDMKIKLLVSKMEKLKADRVATGHYAKIIRGEQKDQPSFQVYTSNDSDNDQSSLVSRLDQKTLSKLIFPLGELRKVDVYKIKESLSLKVFSEKKKEEMCFIKKCGLSRLVEMRAHPSFYPEGILINKKTAVQIGDHLGVHHFSLGEEIKSRHEGFKNFNGGPGDEGLRVVEIMPYHSQIFVDNKEEMRFKACLINNLFLGIGVMKTFPQGVFARIGLEREAYPCQFYLKNNEHALLEFADFIIGPIKGDILTLYNHKGTKAKVIASGIIQMTGEIKQLSRLNNLPPSSEEKKEEIGVTDENVAPVRPAGEIKF